MAFAYGSLVVTRSAGQLNFIENGVPLFSTQNVERIEERPSIMPWRSVPRPGACC